MQLAHIKRSKQLQRTLMCLLAFLLCLGQFLPVVGQVQSAWAAQAATASPAPTAAAGLPLSPDAVPPPPAGQAPRFDYGTEAPPAPGVAQPGTSPGNVKPLPQVQIPTIITNTFAPASTTPGATVIFSYTIQV